MTTKLRRELDELLGLLRDGQLDNDKLARLDSLVAGNPHARRLYINYVDLCASLHWAKRETTGSCVGMGGSREESEAWVVQGGAWEVKNGAAPDIRRPDSESPDRAPAIAPVVIDLSRPLAAPPATFSAFIEGPIFPYMVASVFVCLLLLGFWAHKLPSDRGSSIASNDNSRRSTTSGEASPHDRPAPVFVGRVTGMAGAKWSDDPDYIAPLGVVVALGRTYKLKTGLLEITYDSGAKVILEGPCSYKVDSTAGGFLAVGKLTARVETKGSGFRVQGSEHSPLSTLHSPLFAVRTPTAIVTDLGTEFGVEVDDDGHCFVRVYEGVVEAALIEKNGAVGTPKTIAAGQAATIVRNAEEQSFSVVDASRDAVQFVRELPSLLAYRYRFGANGEFNAAADDLIAAGSSTFSEMKLIRGEIIHNGSLAKLNDGSVYGDNVPGNPHNAIMAIDGTVVEAALNTAVHPSGYDIFSIVSLTGCVGRMGRTGNQDRSSQKYDVAYSTVDAPDDFILLRCDQDATVNKTSYGWPEMQITIACGKSRPIARRVAKLRFTFHDTDSELPHSIYREIDVFGEVNGGK